MSPRSPAVIPVATLGTSPHGGDTTGGGSSNSPRAELPSPERPARGSCFAPPQPVHLRLQPSPGNRGVSCFWWFASMPRGSSAPQPWRCRGAASAACTLPGELCVGFSSFRLLRLRGSPYGDEASDPALPPPSLVPRCCVWAGTPGTAPGQRAGVRGGKCLLLFLWAQLGAARSLCHHFPQSPGTRISPQTTPGPLQRSRSCSRWPGSSFRPVSCDKAGGEERWGRERWHVPGVH